MSEEIPLSQSTGAWREDCFERLARETFDLLVIGGGITGAAVAMRAACEGLSVALVERNDFASGTSSRSSRLIHGGLRYLKQGQVGLVYRSAREQLRLARRAPHLVRPLNLLFPLYGKSLTGRLGHRFGMAVYSALQPLGQSASHARLSRKEFLSRESLLPADGLQGGYCCREYLTHDARLVIETLLAACDAGACAVNYARATEPLFLRNRMVGAAVRDEMTGRSVEVSARVIVNAAGPWADQLINRGACARSRLRLSKGVHIIIPRRLLPLTHAVIFFSPRDKRALVAIPSENFVMVGPTETEYYGAPERAEPESEDVDYLLEALGEFFSSSGIEKNSVIASRAGVRPLYDNGCRSAGQVSRAYHIEWHGEGFLSVLGGKLTLHARAASETVRAIKRELKFRARRHSPNEQLLPGADWKNLSEEMMKGALLEMKVDEDSAHHLIRTYGSRAALFAEMLVKEPALARRINSSLPHILAEATFSIRHEWAARAEDFFERRSDLALSLKAEGESLPADLNRFWRAPAEGVSLRAEEVLA